MLTDAVSNSAPLAINHISVDCVVLGTDGEGLKVLLVDRRGSYEGVGFADRKLPGSLICQDEDLDEAASRVLKELTGLSGVRMVQFKAFGSKDRTKSPRDVAWLERVQNVHVERIVPVAALALVKIDRTESASLALHNASWVDASVPGELAFDHNTIIAEALDRLRGLVDSDLSILFQLLPRKFTAAQLRNIWQNIYRTTVDVRNFHKKIASMEYVVALDERQQGVAHRAARFYKFDRRIYNKSRR